MLDYIKGFMNGMLDNLPLVPEQASTMAGKVDALTLTWTVISFISGTIVVTVMAYFMVRYHRKHAGDVGGHETHAPMVELISMAIPFVICMLMFVWGSLVFVDMKRPPEDSVEYFAFGKQWMWKYQHPNGFREINDLTIPVNTPIRMTMTSEDVIHSFFIPAFRVKQDVLPGRYTQVWFEATKTGTFRQLCAEYCGSEHSYMGGVVRVLEQDEYEAWLDDSAATLEAPAATGEQLFTDLACSTCHTGEDQGRGPTLHGLMGNQVQLASGTSITADEAYVRESIVDPRAKIRAGYQSLMPTFEGQINEEQLFDLVEYIKHLDTHSSVEEHAEETAATDSAQETQTAEANAEPARVATGG